VKGFDLISPGWDRAHLTKETHRVYEVCDGCRRCFNLCPSFSTLFDRIDSQDGDVSRLAAADLERIADECYYCKLCYNHCPYTPPHQFEIDFPRLMVAWKKQVVRERGARLRDRLLVETDLLGKIGSLLAPLTNWALRSRPLRVVGEWLFGVHRNRDILPYQSRTLLRWWAGRRPASSSGVAQAGAKKVALFGGCLLNYQATEIGKAAVQVLERNGVQVVIPEQQCCGMPRLDLGDTDGIARAARSNTAAFVPYLDDGFEIVAPVPSCSLMLKREYPNLAPGAETERLAQHTFDLCEYLMRLKRSGQLNTDFVRNPGRVAYQVPCHLRDQNIGFKSKELLELTGARVRVVERCSGHDGAWSAKVEFFQPSMSIAAKAVKELTSEPAELFTSDCPLAALQLDQAGIAPGGNRRTVHPIEILRDAYGLPA
jgi:glycerol-3-phosphate dehydrogenase subunit C